MLLVFRQLFRPADIGSHSSLKTGSDWRGGAELVCRVLRVLHRAHMDMALALEAAQPASLAAPVRCRGDDCPVGLVRGPSQGAVIRSRR